MRFAIVSLVSCLLFAALPAAADPEPGDPPAADEPGDEVNREELERKKREVREMERRLREQERAREAERVEEELRRRREADRDDYDDRSRDRRYGRDAGDMRVWFGVGTGIAYGWVDTVCGGSGFGAECSEQGLLNTYMGNLTVSAPNGMALRVRGVRATDPGNDEHVPYETAAMIGSRFGRSNWYGLFGAGVLHNLDDDFVKGGESTTGLAWEVIFAPSTYGPMGLELGFQGNSGNHSDFIAFNFGVRFGALR